MILDDNYIVINYHYVHNPDEQSLVGAFPCSVVEFERQVKYLSENYQIVSIEELYKASQSGAEGRFVSLTFDDGLQDHHKNVLPVMSRYGAKGTFFIITDSFKGKISVAHKVHLLRSRFSYKELADFYNKFAGEFIPTDSFIDSDERYDDIVTSNFKTTITRLPPILSNKFLLSIFTKLGWEEKEKAQELFMAEKEIIDLQGAGMAVGSHGESHNSLLALSSETIKKEAMASKRDLENILGHTVNIFSYPHGQQKPGQSAILKDLGFVYGVTTKRRALVKGDDSLLIPRYDTNDLRDAI